jgi:hypothetical protein
MLSSLRSQAASSVSTRTIVFEGFVKLTQGRQICTSRFLGFAPHGDPSDRGTNDTEHHLQRQGVSDSSLQQSEFRRTEIDAREVIADLSGRPGHWNAPTISCQCSPVWFALHRSFLPVRFVCKGTPGQ